jgi:hypothetical protein
VPSEEPAAGTTTVVADKPAEEPEAGAVSDGSDGAVEATVVDAPVSSPSEESAGVDDILSKVMPRWLLVRCYAFQSKCLLVYRLARLWGLARIVRPNLKETFLGESWPIHGLKILTIHWCCVAFC